MFVFTAAETDMSPVLINRDDNITVFRLSSLDMSIRLLSSADQPTDTSLACKATLEPWNGS
jgi:hypothetical protein